MWKVIRALIGAAWVWANIHYKITKNPYLLFLLMLATSYLIAGIEVSLIRLRSAVLRVAKSFYH